MLTEIENITKEMLQSKRQARQFSSDAVVIPRGKAMQALNKAVNFLIKKMQPVDNRGIDLVQILKDVPRGTKFYTSVYGWVKLEDVSTNGRHQYPIMFEYSNDRYQWGILGVTKEGFLYDSHVKSCCECIVFPSDIQRDWSKYKYVKE